MATYSGTHGAVAASSASAVRKTLYRTELQAPVTASVDGEAVRETLYGTELQAPVTASVDGEAARETLYRTALQAPATTRVDGFAIPTGQFRSVTVYVEDTQGEPLKSARWIQSAGLFPTAARVREAPDGRMVARLWLLDAAYQEFTVIGDSGRENVDYVWYQQTTGDGPAVGGSDREATLRFSKQELTGGGGLSVAPGINL